MAITYNSITKEVQVAGAKATGTASSGGTNTLTDATSWTTNIYVWHIIRITSGTGSGQVNYIKSNTSTTLTLVNDWETVPDSTSVYNIAWTPADCAGLTNCDYAAGTGVSAIRFSNSAGLKIRTGGYFGYAMNPIIIFDEWTIGAHAAESNNQMISTETGSYIDLGIKTSDGFGINGGSILFPGTKALVPVGVSVLGRMYWRGNYTLNGTNLAITYNFLPDFGGVALKRWIQLFLYGTGEVNDSSFNYVQHVPQAGTHVDNRAKFLTAVSGLSLALSSNYSTHNDVELVSSCFTINPLTTTVQGTKYTGINFSGDIDSTGRYSGPCTLYSFTNTTAGYIPMAIILNAYSTNPDFVGKDFLMYDTYTFSTLLGYVWLGRRVEFTIKDASGSAITGATISVLDNNSDHALCTSTTGTNPAVPVYSSFITSDSNGEVTGDPLFGRLQQSAWSSRYAKWSTNYPVYPFSVNVRKYGYIFQQVSRDGVSQGQWGNEKGNAIENFNLAQNTLIGETTEATVAAYTGVSINGSTKTITISADRTAQEIYDFTQYWAALGANTFYEEPIVTIDGNNFSLKEDWDLIVNTGITVTATGKKFIFSGTGTWTLTGTAEFNGLMQDATQSRVPITVTNIVSGSRLYIEKDSDSSEIYNDIITGTTYSLYYTETTATDVTIRLRNASGATDYKSWETGGTVSLASGLLVQASQQLDQ